MTWLAFGVWYGYIFSLITPYLADSKPTIFPALMIYFVPAIGGFVVVAQMLMSYGSCIEIGEANI